jgi:hypothetical protein
VTYCLLVHVLKNTKKDGKTIRPDKKLWKESESNEVERRLHTLVIVFKMLHEIILRKLSHFGQVNRLPEDTMFVCKQ